eukprot:scaffold17118_cov40-Prasinocladus_malaysianus.AAC.1
MRNVMLAIPATAPGRMNYPKLSRLPHHAKQSFLHLHFVPRIYILADVSSITVGQQALDWQVKANITFSACCSQQCVNLLDFLLNQQK